jgi:site-specific recombinase XerD
MRTKHELCRPALFQEYKYNKTQEFLRNTFGIRYASGLRRSEVFNLEEKDIDFERQIAHLHNPKPGKDKYVELSNVYMYFINNQILAKAVALPAVERFFSYAPPYCITLSISAA